MDEMLTRIGDYGIAYCLTGVVLYGAIQLMNIYLTKLKASHGTVEETGAEEKAKQDHMQLIEVRRTVDPQINTVLNRLLLKANADRAYVFELHNGGSNITGLPFLRMTNTYEITSPGTPCRIIGFSQLPASILQCAVADLFQTDGVIIQREGEHAVGKGFTAEYMSIAGMDTCVLSKITNISGEIVGFCGVDFLVNTKNRDPQVIKEMVSGSAVELGSLLSIDL